MDEIEEMLTALLNKATEKKVNLLDAIKDNPAGKAAIFQPLFNDGHAKATAVATIEKEKLEKRALDAETALQASQKKVTKLTEENPDVAKIHEQYGREIKKLERDIEAAKEAGTARLIESKRESGATALEAELVGLGVDRDYAEVQSLKASNRSRILVDDKTQKFQVMQPDKPDIPYAGSERDQIKSLAVEIKATIKNPAFLISGVPGGGTGKETAPASNEGAKGLYDGIRQRAKDAAAAKTASSSSEELARRLGTMRR